MEKELEKRIKQLGITIPIVHVKGVVYLVGCQKQIVKFQSDNLILRIGGGYEKFDDYIPNNHRMMERQLLANMIKSKESLEWVCDAIINDRKIPNSLHGLEMRDQFKGVKGGNNEMLEINKRLPKYASKMVLQTSSPNRMDRGDSPTRNRRSTIKGDSGFSSPFRRSTASPAKRQTVGGGSPGRKSMKTPTKVGSPSSKSPMGKKADQLALEKYQKDREQILHAIKVNHQKKMDNVKRIDGLIANEYKALRQL